MRTYEMFTDAGDQLVDAYVQRAVQRDWPIGTPLGRIVEWVQRETADAGRISQPDDWEADYPFASEVHDTAVREAIAAALETHFTEKES